jgi:hypothetical protein
MIQVARFANWFAIERNQSVSPEDDCTGTLRADDARFTKRICNRQFPK